MVAGRVTCHTGQEKSKTAHRLLLQIAFKIAIFLHWKRKFMSFKGEINAEFSDIAEYFDVIEMRVSPCEDGRPYALLTNAYPGACTPYT